MRFIYIIITAIFSCLNCICMTVVERERMEKFERMSAAVKQEMIDVAGQFELRADSYSEFLDCQNWQRFNGLNRNELDNTINTIVNTHRTVNRLRTFLGTLTTQKNGELSRINDEWWVFASKDDATRMVNGNFSILQEKVNTFVNTIRDELNPRVRVLLYRVIQSSLESEYCHWAQTNGMGVPGLLLEELKKIRGKSETEPEYMALKARIKDIQTLPTNVRTFSGTEESIFTELKTKYPIGMVEEHGEEVLKKIRSNGKTFIHIPGAKDDFFAVFFKQLGILPVSKSMLDLVRSENANSVNRILRGSETNKGWILNALQNLHNGKMYLNSVLFITDAHAFFGRAGTMLPAREVINFLTILTDPTRKEINSPFLFDTMLNIRELKIIMVGDGDFLDDFFASPPASLIQEECDSFSGRCDALENYVAAPSGLLSTTALRRQIEIELNKHEKFSQLKENLYKQKIKERTRALLQGGVVPAGLKCDFTERCDYTKKLEKREIIPHIKKALDYYIDEFLRDGQ